MSDLVEITVKVKSDKIADLLYYLDLTKNMKDEEAREATRHRIKLDILRLCSGELLERSNFFKVNDKVILDYESQEGE